MDVSQVPFFSIAMENLLAAHENDPVCYASEESHDSAFILHTSGTTKGTRKMLPFTDKVFNDSLNMMPEGHHSLIEGPDKYKPLRLIQLFDMSSVMALAGMIHGLSSASCIRNSCGQSTITMSAC